MKHYFRKTFCVLLFFSFSRCELQAQCYFTTSFNPPNFCTNFAGFFPFENIVNNNPPYQVIATANGVGQASVCTSIHPSISSLRGSGSGCVIFLVLPVSLLSFNGTSNSDHSVSLTWQTTAEKNNKGFGIERSADGHSFFPIAFVAGKENPESVNSYTYKDLLPTTGNNYYRLKQIDLDGSFAYSSLVFATIHSQHKIAVSPNPVTSTMEIKGDDLYPEFFIYNSTGKLMISTTDQTVDVSWLSPGLYVLKNNYHSLLFIKE